MTRLERRSIDLVGSPDLRILLINLASKYGCTIEFHENGRASVVGVPGRLKETVDTFNAIRVDAMLRRAIIVAVFPDIHVKTVEADWMNGFVSQACFYISGVSRKTLNTSAATLAGGSFADEYFQERIVRSS